jgi:hypothetical protein
VASVAIGQFQGQRYQGSSKTGVWAVQLGRFSPGHMTDDGSERTGAGGGTRESGDSGYVIEPSISPFGS